ncbi:MAG TPA: hypothetical protein PKC99_06395 [Anaerolineales bacterium]|nr:hypothetical protein [Anaerolineales bacterium]MBL1170848.1 hypothetical protein [Chloroflexota bacterium]NOG74296.1 hypothetical protein [Chloroflexota bacterium]WKZ55537.1 MAG: hypothetical protein QY324_05780 [Anaerolineales bacterium]GIK09073.1 MAG: hypothetical protein BroJett001_11390 [Chloroflexota bacterium]
MTLAETFALVSFSIFSYADLRYRLVPGIEVFLFGTILLTFPATPIQTGIVLLACLWGIFRNLSGWFAIPLLFYPPVWPVLFTGYGYRKSIIGRADLLAISGLACLFPLPAVLLSLLGLELWRRLWVRRQHGDIPALPGLLLGLIVYLLLRLFLPTP